MPKITESYEVDPVQFEETHTTVHDLLDKIFGHDSSEDPNVEFILINRELCWPMHFVPIPYDHKEGADEDKILDLSLMNLSMAMEQVRIIQSGRMRKLAAKNAAEVG